LHLQKENLLGVKKMANRKNLDKKMEVDSFASAERKLAGG
jgi:hypothetical protein